MRLITTIFLFVLLSGVALAQSPASVHVKSTHTESREEVSAGEMKDLGGLELIYTTYTVDAGTIIYILESADNRRPEIGKDYEVKSLSADEMVLLIPGKKRPASVRFHIKSMSEK